MTKSFSFVLSVILFMFLLLPMQMVNAQSNPIEDMSNAQAYVDQALEKAIVGNLSEADQFFQQFKKIWRQIEEGVKEHSGKAYKDIESEMGKVIYALSRNQKDEVVEALTGLKTVNQKFIDGGYPKGDKLEQKNISLEEFIAMLQEVKEYSELQQEDKALDEMEMVTDSWLSVEGVVVSQSAKVYSDSERDLVTIKAMLTNTPPDYNGANQLIDQMTNYLTPLASKSSYTIWDAAMIIIREGLEALLVIIALLAFVNKSNHSKGKGWIWSGVLGGILVSIILAIIIKILFSSGAFGNNNALIGGWSALIAAIMLLYVSYWLHSNANLKQWQNYIKTKTEVAISTGKLISLGLISFLAVFREGTETVLFFIGMVNQISIQDMLLGLGSGLVSLIILAYFMIYIGVKLPIRPFFIVSSIIVFYLTIKFLGMGIHSLQMAGLISTTQISIPSIDLFALYPSLESTVPQVILITVALLVVFWKKRKKRKKSK